LDHKVTTSIIIIEKIEVSPRQPLETPILKPRKGPKSKENEKLAMALIKLTFETAE